MASSSIGIRLFNTLTREKEPFIPLEEGEVRMYTCGPTVYDYAHIGNFRAFIFEDLLKRWLKHRGFKVTHIMNLTDVDDKTIKGSKSLHIPLKQYTDFYAKAFFEDAAALNIEPANIYPRATDHVPEMVTLIKTLLAKDFAYKGDDGSIYFAINKFPDYGKLSKIQVHELKAGARVRVDEYAKEEAQDFALWKAWTPEDGNVYWETELGKGRPGWHIECSAMSMKYLGDTFDIHVGGVDNMFPHHENEVAQSEAATGKPFVRYWLHNEHLLVEGKKMAKRFGNYYTFRDLQKKGCDTMAIRYLLLSTHYRQQFNFTFEGLEAARSGVERLGNVIRRLQAADGKSSGDKIVQLIDNVERCFGDAMDDDLNVSVALASLFDFVREINNLLDANNVSKHEASQVHSLLKSFDKVLGVVGEVKEQETLPKEAQDLIAKREEARRAKDWKTADTLRKQLKAMDIIIEDTQQGVRWKIEKA
jgi:cysteinyl-tRNA synthetase